MIIGYCRVSSREQLANSEALKQQKARVEPHCDRIIVDITPRSTLSRPGWEEIKRLVISGECTKIVCTRIDRLGTLTLIPQIIEFQTDYGCNIQCLDDDFDLSTATGRFHANIVGSVAQMEVEMLSERVRHGWSYFRKQKKIHSPAFGYRVNGENRLEVDHSPFVCLISSKKAYSRYQIARLLIEWYIDPPPDLKGRRRSSLQRVLELLNTTFGVQVLTTHKGRAAYGALRFSKGGLSGWFDNPALSGHTAYLKKRDGQRQKKKDWVIERNTHEPIITEAEAEAIARLKKTNRFQAHEPRTKRRFAISGLVKCKRCGAVCYLQSGSRGKQPGYNYYYQCQRWTIKACSNKKMVRVEKAEDALIDALVDRAEILADWYALGDPIKKNDFPPEILELQDSLDALERLPFNPAIEESKLQLQKQINEATILHSEENKQAIARDEMLAELNDRRFWSDADNDTKLKLYNAFASAIWVDDGEIVGVDFK